MMCVIGLEMHIDKLWAIRRSVIAQLQERRLMDMPTGRAGSGSLTSQTIRSELRLTRDAIRTGTGRPGSGLLRSRTATRYLKRHQSRKHDSRIELADQCFEIGKRARNGRNRYDVAISHGC
jgi:hypothetical protein